MKMLLEYAVKVKKKKPRAETQELYQTSKTWHVVKHAKTVAKKIDR